MHSREDMEGKMERFEREARRSRERSREEERQGTALRMTDRDFLSSQPARQRFRKPTRPPSTIFSIGDTGKLLPSLFLSLLKFSFC